MPQLLGNSNNSCNSNTPTGNNSSGGSIVVAGNVDNTTFSVQPTAPKEPKLECDKCNLSFNRLELLKEHQLMHILNTEPFFNDMNPFALLQGLHNHGEDLSSKNTTKPISRRKFSTESTSNDAVGSGQEDIAKKFQKEQFEFLVNYFIQNETNDELKKHSATLNFEFLLNFYQTNEIKKNNLLKNYDFLHQYYQQHRDDNDVESVENQEKLTLDFLLQFYQINESKKLFEQQQQQTQQQHQPLQQSSQFSSNLSTTSSSSHTGALDSGEHHHQTQPSVVTTTEKQTNKRLRTTILPEQLNFLYECYQNESNPSRKMLEEISKKVNLKKRVVQVKLMFVSRCFVVEILVLFCFNFALYSTLIFF